MRDGVEAGSGTSEMLLIKIAGILAAIVLPILNGLIIKLAGPDAALTPVQFSAVIVSLVTLAVGYVAARTSRKNAAATAGLQNSANMQTAQAISAARAITDPTERAKALDEATKGI